MAHKTQLRTKEPESEYSKSANQLEMDPDSWTDNPSTHTNEGVDLITRLPDR